VQSQKKLIGLIVALLCCIAMTGCSGNVMSTVLPSAFGEDAVFGEEAIDLKKVVYGHIAIDLPSGYSSLGTVDVTWTPAVTIPDLSLPQYLSTTFYESDGTYFLTQWTRLDTDKFYFKPLSNETVERWGHKWQVTTFTVPTGTVNSEYAQYIAFMKKNDETLPEAFAVKVYAKRFSGRVIVRVLEFVPSTGGSVLIPQFQELYPITAYSTIGAQAGNTAIVP
jgi:hypothetical protein